ncbi:hypothetical protein [Actinocrispum sp. NPDC049592]|uniref:hypothetical protein n=1 Tax=Actinocrispum sp. NPDC049592 TaxID=3154835 RepID=UPI003433922A
MTVTAERVKVTPRSTTKRRLQRWVVGLLAVSVVLVGLSWWFYEDVHRTIDTVRTKAAPAQLAAAAAKSALAKADYLALHSFPVRDQTGTPAQELSGWPGDQYQNQIAVVSQSLAQVAEDNLAGDAGSQQIQLVEGLLVAYTGWIEQADMHRREGSDVLATVDIWYASRLLNTTDTGVLAQMDLLLKTQQEAMDDQLPSGFTGIVRTVLLGLSFLALAAMLVLVQVFLRWRFRRSVNIYLGAATVLLVGFAVFPVVTVVAQGQLSSATGELRDVVDVWQSRTADTVGAGQQQLNSIMVPVCRDGCGETVARFGGTAAPPWSGRQPALNDPDIGTKTKQANQRIADAGVAGLDLVLVLAGLALIALVVAGFWRRILEYRFEAR